MTAGRPRRAWLSALVLGAVLLTGCGGGAAAPTVTPTPVAAVTVVEVDGDDGGPSAPDLESGLGDRAEGRTVVVLQHADPADPFHATIRRGAVEAGALLDLDLQLRSSGDDQAGYAQLILDAVAEQPDGLALTLDDPDRYTDAVCAAHRAGIPVVVFNIDQPASEVDDCIASAIVQDFVAAGRLVGERLAAAVDLQPGDVVLAPVEFPDQRYAMERAEGVRQGLSSTGATLEVIGTGIADLEALRAMASALEGRDDIVAVTPLGGTPHRNVLAAMDTAGASLPVVGFDVDPSIIAGIRDGRIIATADQQGYVQGFQAVLQLGLLLDLGLAPTDVDAGGTTLLDAGNADIVDELLGLAR